MLRTTAQKVAWVGRTASMVFGLALVMALVLGVASMAFAANGNNFVLGVLNNSATAVTRLVGNVNGSALQVVNNNADPNDTALDLRVQDGEAPMRVSSPTKMANLNADTIDGKNSSAFAPKATEAWHTVGTAGEPQFTSGTCNNVGPGTNACNWQNYGFGWNNAAFFKDSSGIVHLKGMVVPNGCSVIGSCIHPNPSGLPQVFVLPSSYRPSAQELQDSLLYNNSYDEMFSARVDISPNGRVIPIAMTGDPDTIHGIAWLSLDGITFRAAS